MANISSTINIDIKPLLDSLRAVKNDSEQTSESIESAFNDIQFDNVAKIEVNDSEIQKFKDTFENFKIDIDTNNALNSFEKLATSIESEIKQLELDKITFDTEILNLDNQIAQSKSKIATLKNEKIELNSEIKGVDSDIAIIKGKLKSIEKAGIQFDPDTQNFSQEYSQLLTKLKTLENNKVNLNLEKANIDKSISDIRNGIKEIEDNKVIIYGDSVGLENQINSLKGDLSNINVKLNVNDSELTTASKKVSQIDGEKATVKIDADSNLDSVGTQIDDIKAKLKESVGGGFIDTFKQGGIIGVGIAAATAGIEALTGAIGGFISGGVELNNSLRDLENQAKMTGSNFQDLKAGAEQAFKFGVGENLAEATSILGKFSIKLGSVFTGKELGEFVGSASAIGKILDVDVTEVLTKAEPVIKQFGLTGKESFDLLALAATKGSSAQNDILDSLAEYSQLAREAGFSAFQFGELLTRGTSAGLFNTDKIADSLKETQIRLKAGDFKKAFEDLGASSKGAEKDVAKNINDILTAAEDGQITIQEALQKSTSEIAKGLNTGQISESFANKLAVGIAGTPAEDLGIEIFSKIFSAPLDEVEIRKKAAEAGSLLSNTLGQYTSFEGLAKDFDIFIANLGASFISFFDSFIAPIIGGVVVLFGRIKDAFNEVFSGGAAAGIKQFTDLIANTIAVIVEVLSNNLVPVFKFVFNLIANVLETLSDTITFLGEAFSGLVGDGNGFLDFLGELSDIGSLVFDVISELVKIFLNLANLALKPVIGLVAGVVGWFFDLVKSLFGVKDGAKLGAALMQELGRVLQNIKGTLSGVSSAFDFVTSALGKFIKGLASFNLKEAINAFSGFGDNLKKEYDKGWNEAKKTVEKTNEEIEKIQAETVAKLNKQADELYANRNKLSKEELLERKRDIEKEISAELQAGNIQKQNAEQLANRLKGIKANVVTDSIKQTEREIEVNKQQYKDYTIDLRNILQGGIKAAFESLAGGNDEIIKETEKQTEKLQKLFDSLSFENTDSGGLIDKFDEIKKKLPELALELDLDPKDFENISNSSEYLDFILSKVNSQINDLQNSINKGLDAKAIIDIAEATQNWASDLQTSIGLLDVQSIEKKLVDITNALNEKEAKLRIEVDPNAKRDLQIEIDKLSSESKELNLQLNDANLIKNINDAIFENEKKLNSLLLDPELNEAKILEISEIINKLSLDLANATIEASQNTANGVNLSIEETRTALQNVLNLAKEKGFEGQIKPLQDAKKELDKFSSKVGTTKKQLETVETKGWQNLSKLITDAINSFNLGELVNKNNEVADSVREIESAYKDTFKTIGDELKNGEINYQSYVDKLAQAESERLTKIKETESERGNLTSQVNESLSNSFGKLQELMNTATKDILVKAMETGGGVLSVGDAVSASFTTVIDSIGAGFGKAIADGKTLWKALLIQILDGVQVMMNAYSAALFLQKNAEYPFGVGSVVWAGMVAVANGLFELAKSQIGAEKGYNPNNSKGYGKKGKSDTVQLWVTPNEAILTEQMTKTNKDLINYWFNGKSTDDYFKDSYKSSFNDLRNINMKNLLNDIDLRIDKKLNDKLKFDYAKNVNQNFKEKTIINNVNVIEKTGKFAFEHSFGNVKLNNNDIEFAVYRSQKQKIRRG